MNEDEVVVGDGDGDAVAEVAAIEDAAGVSSVADGKPTADADDAGKTDDADDGDDPEKGAKKVKKGKLPPEIQEEIDARIGKEVGKRKELEERLDRAEARARELEEAAEARETAKTERPASNLGALSERELVKREQDLRNFMEWADETLQEMGTEPDATVTVGDATWTRADIKAKRSAFRRELQDGIPAAREAGKVRTQLRDTVVKEHYPELLDSKTEAAAVLRRTAKAFPDLASHPMFEVMVGDMLEGERRRNEKKGKPGGGEGGKPAPIPKAGASTPAARPGGVAAPGKKTPNLERIAEGSDEALVEALMDE